MNVRAALLVVPAGCVGAPVQGTGVGRERPATGRDCDLTGISCSCAGLVRLISSYAAVSTALGDAVCLPDMVNIF